MHIQKYVQFTIKLLKPDEIYCITLKRLASIGCIMNKIILAFENQTLNLNSEFYYVEKARIIIHCITRADPKI